MTSERTKADGRYLALLEAAPDAMVVVDQDGEIVLLNRQAEKQFGYQRDELLGQRVTNIIPDGFAERLIADDLRSAADALAQQIGTGIELTARRKDGSEFPIEIMLSPLESPEGILVTAAIRDISVRKAAEAELLQAQKLESIGRLAGGIAHDFNNMLFVIHGYAELLSLDVASEENSVAGSAGQALMVDAILDASERAARLTAQLLAFSRQQIVTQTVIDINAAIAALEPMVTQVIGGNAQLVLRLSDTTGHIRADAGQIDQIVVNLVVNARDAMPDGGTVTIETRIIDIDAAVPSPHLGVGPGPQVMVTVRDTGVGMDRQVLERIFEPFFTTKELGRGTGLGLATTHGIVKQAGGHITIDSRPGGGSAFHIYFPRVDAPVDAPPRVAPAPVDGIGRILVVEDQVEIREMTALLLGRIGFEVITAADADQALTAAASPGGVDVLVSDVVMPGLSGITLAELMMERYPALGVVLLSGYAPNRADLERVTAAGAVFLAKPVSSDQLLRAVGGAAAARRTITDVTNRDA
jgi:PAS domain S-box-containing protein